MRTPNARKKRNEELTHAQAQTQTHPHRSTPTNVRQPLLRVATLVYDATARIQHLRDGRDGSAAGTSNPNPALVLDGVLDRRTRLLCATYSSVASCSLSCCRIWSIARPSSSTWVRVARSAAAQRKPDRFRRRGSDGGIAANARVHGGTALRQRAVATVQAEHQRRSALSTITENGRRWVPHLRCRFQQRGCGYACRFWRHRRERRAVHAHRGCCRFRVPHFA